MKILSAYWELTKPRLTSMVIFTVWLGYALAVKPVPYNATFFHMLLGSWLLAAAGAALNQWMERDRDALMRRTERRPLPDGRLTPKAALFFGLALTGLGTAELAWFVNGLTTALGLLTLLVYVGLYTPLKTRTSLCTLVGAIPGALPPMMGWAAARGTLDLGAWVLFLILFLWQLPHFLAIAWMCREDYARAGFPMLSVIDPRGTFTARMILLYTAVLIPVTLLPARLGMAGFSYAFGALLLGGGFFACGAVAAWRRNAFHARRLLLASVFYLPLLLVWMAL
jgi:heme o synthase